MPSKVLPDDGLEVAAKDLVGDRTGVHEVEAPVRPEEGRHRLSEEAEGSLDRIGDVGRRSEMLIANRFMNDLACVRIQRTSTPTNGRTRPRDEASRRGRAGTTRPS